MINIYIYVFLAAWLFTALATRTNGPTWQNKVVFLLFAFLAVNGWWIVARHLWFMATH